MKRRIVWSLIGAMLLFGGCGAEPEAADMDIAQFSFGQSGSSLYEFHDYTVAKTEAGVSFQAELEGGHLVLDVMVEDSVLEQLEEITQRNHLEKWDGFHKTNKHVLDGNSFSLLIRMTDGTQISASGNNSYPKGYGEAEKEILTLFQDLIEKYSDQLVDTMDMMEETTEAGEGQPEP